MRGSRTGFMATALTHAHTSAKHISWQHISVKGTGVEVRVGDWLISETYWPASLSELMEFRLIEKLCF